MSKTRNSMARIAPLLLSIGLTGAAFAATGIAASETPLRCEIAVHETGGMIALEGNVESDTPASGIYRFAVESVAGAGNSRIRQGGEFAVAPGETVKLGNVMLGANGVYDASLSLETSAGTVSCEQRAGRI